MTPRQLREACLDRDGWRCAATGLHLTWETANMHHRRPGGRGGTSRANQHTLPNVIALLAEAHNMGSPGLVVDGMPGRSVHTDPLWSKPLGLLLSSHVDDPGSVPVRVAGVGWVFLTEAGGYLRLT